MGSTRIRTTWRAVVAMSLIVVLAAACTTTGSGASSGTSAAASPAPVASPAAAASASSGGGKYGGDGEGDDYGTRTPVPSASSDDSTDPKVHEVNVGNSDDGPYLTGADGLALYVFGNDSANTSTCSGGCAKTWHPFTIDDGDTLKSGSGVKGKLTTFKRVDGSMQVAYDGSPLYYYSLDVAAGDTKGQGVGDVWYIATP
jgi:predicted lipoprotein with Yx(FWY)xxD motif